MGVAAAKARADVVDAHEGDAQRRRLLRPGPIREDGRKLSRLPVRGEVAGREQGAWDYYKLMTTTPAEEAFRPLNEGGCNLVKS